MRYPLPTQRGIPAIVNGYELDADGPWFSVIIPEASVNLCVNPSFETDTAGWSAGAGALSRVSTYQRFGTYCAKYLPTAAVNDGLYLGTSAASLIPTTAGQWYTASLYIKGAGGAPYQLYWADQWGNRIGNAKTFAAPNDWGRVVVTWFETQTTSRRLYLAKNDSANIYPFYVDGVLIENKAYATTYFDGDSVGFVVGVSDFSWSGARHASTSIRTAQTGAGGRPVKLKDFGFRLLAVVGLGMPGLKPISQDYGWQDGALYQRTRKPPRDFTLAGYVSGSSSAELQRARAQLEAAFSPDNLKTQQPMVLLYDYSDECGNVSGDTLRIQCVYQGGLEGNLDNLYAEKVALAFTMHLPLVQNTCEAGAALGYQTTVANANYIIRQDTAGTWSALATGANNKVMCMAIAPDGSLYVGGGFTTPGNYIAKYSPTTGVWTDIGASFNEHVRGLAVAADGTLYAVGNFTTPGNRIAKYSGGVWSTLGTGMSGGATPATLTVIVAADGSVIAGGWFTTAGGVPCQNIAKWNGATWAALDAGLGPDVLNYVGGLLYGLDSKLYAGGGFITPTHNIAVWNGTAWAEVGVGMNGAVNGLTTGPDGMLYAVGEFTTPGNCIAKWNGATWEALGTGLNDFARDSVFLPDGRLVVVGDFTTAGGLTLPDRMAIWNGSSWGYVPVDLPGNPYVYTALYDANLGLFLGFDTAGNATASTVTTVVNPGTEPAYPLITLTGPGTVYQIQNVTTGDTLNFNLVLQAGEVATLDLTSGNISFISKWRGNILSTILPGSNLASFKLLPGANSIGVLIAGATSAATAADLRLTPQYLGLERA